MPQKNPLGKDAVEAVENCGGLVGDVGAAFDGLLQAVNVEGIPAAAPAPRIDCTNLRRVRCKLGEVSFTCSYGFKLSNIFQSLSAVAR